MYNDHSNFQYFVNKLVLGERICRWLLLFQEYDIEVILKPRKLNAGLDHFSRLESGVEGGSLDDALLDAQLFSIRIEDDKFGDIVQFISIGTTHVEYTTAQKKQLVVCTIDCQLIAGHLYKWGLMRF